MPPRLPENLSDRDQRLLADLCRRGVASAYTKLVEAHLPLAYGAACRLHADESAQELSCIQAFRQLWEDAPKIAAARTLVPGFLMREMRRRLPVHPKGKTLPTGGDWANLAPALDAAMASLPPQQQDAITLRYFCDQTLIDAASILGLPEKSLQALLIRSLDHLCVWIARHGVQMHPLALSAMIRAKAQVIPPPDLASKVVAAVQTESAAKPNPLPNERTRAELSSWRQSGIGLAAALVFILLPVVHARFQSAEPANPKAPAQTAKQETPAAIEVRPALPYVESKTQPPESDFARR